VASAAATTSLTALTWPLTGYAESADHVLQAHIIDELGLAAETGQVTVNVSVQVPAAVEQAPAPIRLLQQPGVPLLALALTGLALALAIGAVAWWSVSRRNQAQAEAEAPQAAAAMIRPAKAQTAASPPLGATAPNIPLRPAASETPHGTPRAASRPGQTRPLSHPPRPGLPSSRALLRWPGGRTSTPLSGAYLEVVEPGGGSAPRGNIELVGESVTLGRDGALAETVFHDRSVSRLHARIVALNGVFLLYDAGSTSGTWVNYAPLPPETGYALQHGDLINLGRVQLRFRRSDAPPAGSAARVEKVDAAPVNGSLLGASGPHFPGAEAAGGAVEKPE
jgi:pSer/pThr/pTyr-binding forkhead associated (FHA) protein